MRLAHAILAAITAVMLVGTSCLHCGQVPGSTIAGQAEGAMNVPLALTPEEDRFYVSFDVSSIQSQKDAYPVTWDAFERALMEWSRHVPVRWVTLPAEHPVAHRPGVVGVLLADLQADPFNASDDLLGLWDLANGRILLDADRLEQNPEQAYSVALHELGHVLGVPHIIGFNELGYTGWLVLPPGQNPTNYVMYYRAVTDHPQKVLSNLEIMIARHHLVHRWTEPSSGPNKHDCELYTEGGTR